jgi:hypothetical protein
MLEFFEYLGLDCGRLFEAGGFEGFDDHGVEGGEGLPGLFREGHWGES